MKPSPLLLSTLFFGIALSAAHANVGHDETGGMSVPSGDTSNLTARVALAEGGRLVKAGDGTLVLAPAAVESAVPWRLAVTAGTLALSPNTAAAPADDPPAATAKAAFWVDASADNGTLVLAGDGTTVTRWCDRRETAPSSPTRFYAEHACRSGASTDTPQAYVHNAGTNAVWFGGYDTANGAYMKFYVPGGAAMDKQLGSIHHVFLVHGVFDAWGSPLGQDAGSVADMFMGASIVDASSAARHFIYYGTTSPSAFTARHWLDGVKFDPYSVPPKTGFQLYEADYLDYPSSANAFYCSRPTAGRQGGDYLSEALVFTNRLSEAERLDVERYLLRKWGLGTAGAGTLSLAPGATATAEIADGSESFGGATVDGGLFVKGGAGTLALTQDSSLRLTEDTTLSLSAGDAFVQARPLPALAAAPGDRLFAGETNPGAASPATPSGHAQIGVTLSRTPGAAAADTIVKSGKEEVRLRSVPADVATLVVEEGPLALVGEAPTDLAANAAVNAMVPNADFEIPVVPDGTYNRKRIPLNGTLNGWTCYRQGTSAGAYYLIENREGYTGRGTMSPWPIVQGSQTLLLYREAAASAPVTFPAPGRYVLSWREAATTGGSYSTQDVLAKRARLTVKLGADASTAVEVFPPRPAMWGPFTRFRCELPEITEAAVQTLFLESGAQEGLSVEGGVCIDDLRIDFLPYAAEQGVTPIPNGDFEAIGSLTNVVGLSRSVASTGWTLSGLGDGTEPAVAIATPASPALKYWNTQRETVVRWGDVADVRDGVAALAFASTTGTASTTFRLAAGSYRLRGKTAHWEVSWNGAQNPWTTYSRVAATVTANGASTSLGTVTCDTHTMATRLWPTSFALAADADVTLTLSQTLPQGMCLVDDLELVAVGSPAETGTGVEMLANGGFETDTGWTRTQASTGDWSSYLPYSQSPAQYGAMPYDGARCLYIQNDSAARQQVALASNALYRVSFATHSRLVWGYEFAPVKAYLANASLANVLDIGYTETFTTNWVVHTWDFRAPADGTYWLVLQGAKVPGEGDSMVRYCSQVDGASLRRLASDAPVAPPAVPENLRLRLAEGARLRLDFDGAIPVDALFLGRRHLPGGRVDASTHPELVSGRGALDVSCRYDATLIFLL